MGQIFKEKQIKGTYFEQLYLQNLTLQKVLVLFAVHKYFMHGKYLLFCTSFYGATYVPSHTPPVALAGNGNQALHPRHRWP